MSDNAIADAISQRVGCYNIGSWLRELATVLNVEPESLMPEPPEREHRTEIAGGGLRLALRHPHAGHVNIGDPDRWILTEVEFYVNEDHVGRWSEALPFGLDSTGETPKSIRSKIGSYETTDLEDQDKSHGDRRQTYFLGDARVLGITWSPGLVGIENIVLVRLGSEIDFQLAVAYVG